MAINKKQRHSPDEPEMPRELEAGAPLEDYLPYQLFRIVNRLTLNLKSDLRPAKMTLSRWRALSVLTASDGRSMGELAAYMVIEQPALSRVVDQLARDGLVTRRLASNDNRVVRVYLTDAGRRKFNAIRPLELHQYERAIEGFEPSELKSLNKLLSRLWTNLAQ